MKEEEKKIQEAIEKGISIPGFGEDEKCYRLLFSELEKEDETMPEFSASFADKIADRIEERAVARSSFKEWVLKAAALCLFILLAGIAVLSAGIATNILESLASIKWYLLTASLLLLAIDYADKKLVRKII